MSARNPPGPMRALVQGASRGLGLELTRQLLSRPDCDAVVATCRQPQASEGLMALAREHGDRLHCLRLDVTNAESVASAAGYVARACGDLHLLLNVAGLLHDGELQPEKRLESVDPDRMRRVFEVNAFGPLLMARHFHALLAHEERSVLANLSARVGSIGDNRAGGWYAYRASKAAQNMFTRTLAIELRRRAPHCICVALHPGTVDTDLSRPFQRNVPDERLFPVERAARQLLAVVDALGPEDSGRFFAWDGEPIPW